MRKKVVGFLSVLLASGVIMAGCGNNTSTEGANESPSENSSEVSSGEEQVLNLVESAEIPSMDPAKASDSVSFKVMNNVYEGLYRLAENDELVEGVAKNHDVSEDGLTYTFHLREDAKWSNGEPVTAHDFVYAWQRALNPTTGSEYAYIMYDLKNAEAVNTGEVDVDQLGVVAEDDYTLVVELENAIPYFAELTVFGLFVPLNQEYVESQGDKFALEADTAIYNGPFTLSEWNHEQGWTYTKNPQYWEVATVSLDKINVNVVKDTATAVNLYETDKADYIILTSDYVDKYSSSDEFSTEVDSSTFYIQLNQVDELENINLRKAISMSFDKETLVEVLLNNGSIAANGLVPKGTATHSSGSDFREANGDLLSYNLEQAQEYWEKAKEELGVDNLTISLLTYDTDASKKMGEYVQAELEKNLEGLTIEMIQQPFKQKLELEQAGDYQISIAGWSADFLDAVTFLDMFVTGGGNNKVKFAVEAYDNLISSAKSDLVLDEDARWNALLEAEQILMDEAVIAPIYQRGSAYLTKSNVHNIYTHQFGGSNSYKWTYIES